jgi:hypothetical protein
MAEARAQVVSSFTVIKGALIDETYAVFREWDFALSRLENLKRGKAANLVGAVSSHWNRDVAKVLNRRFDPAGRDRPLVELAQAGVAREAWRPLLLWHMTRDEFLVRDFLVHWLYPRYVEGVFRLHAEDVVPYLEGLSTRKGITWSGAWAESTMARVATGLLRMAVDFGLLAGKQAKEFGSYHLPEESFLYLLYAMAHGKPNARRIIEAEDWRMYLMDARDVERELLRLHQFRRLHYEVAGSLSQLQLPQRSLADYVRELAV